MTRSSTVTAQKPRKAPKFTRKNLKHDSFVEHTGELAAFLQEHFMKIGIGILVVVVVLVGISFYNQGRVKSSNSAAYLLYQGQSLLARGAYGAAQERLLQCTDRFGGTEFGKRAYLDLAHSLIAMGDPQSALATIEEGLGKVPARGELHDALLLFRATALSDLGRPAEAEAIYRQLLAANPSDVVRVDLTYRLSDCLRDAGRTREAVTVLEELRDAHARGEVDLVQRELETRIFTMRALASS
jgi:tetratricopeptide (TPR) repeat protein